MFEILVKALVYTLCGYAALGIVFALPFVFLGVHRLDSEAQGSGVDFRLLILPGVAAFWPMFLERWLRGVRVFIQVHALPKYLRWLTCGRRRTRYGGNMRFRPHSMPIRILRHESMLS